MRRSSRSTRAFQNGGPHTAALREVVGSEASEDFQEQLKLRMSRSKSPDSGKGRSFEKFLYVYQCVNDLFRLTMSVGTDIFES